MTQQIASQEFAQPLAETQSAAEQQTARKLTAMPLNMAAPGETVVVQEIRGGRKVKQRLLDLGMNPGARVFILKNEVPSPMIVAVKEDGRLALGRGMTQKVIVKLVAEDNHSGGN